MNSIQSIFNDNSNTFTLNKTLPTNKLKAISAIKSCRTASLGAHVDECTSCGHKKISYNSCRNRHCPQCQNLKKEQWINSRQSELINTQYFHVVFTVPNSLNQIIYNNQKILYNLLFKCVAETLSQLASDKKYLGAQIGITSVLHTWGQNLMFHPHIHCIVPGGGLSPSGLTFIHSKKKFFIPVKVLSRKFRGKFLSLLKELFKQGEICIPNGIDFIELVKKLHLIDWVTYCKPPFKSTHHVINYLSRYTHKVAISNNRIVNYSNQTVSFSWKDYRNKNKQKLMKLSSSEFMRRFLLHILPEKFVKIRYFGILGTRNRNTKLLKCQKLTGVNLSNIQRLSKQQLIKNIFGENVFNCSKCGSELISRFFVSPEILLE